jgi:hypothetical protein
MMYTVTWIPSALGELANLWNNALDRRNVADAANRIDSILRLNPYAHSESRDEDFRILFVPPLAVLFDVNDADRLVTVRAVWRPA